MNDKPILGTLTRKMCHGAQWSEEEFPSSQEWADFFEKLLNHISQQGQFERYIERLRGIINQRDGALCEILTSFFFNRHRFKVIDYEPEEIMNRPGDLIVQWRDTLPIFIEVKSPGWKGELTEEEKIGLRGKRPRIIGGESRSSDPLERIDFAIRKALPKFPE